MQSRWSTSELSTDQRPYAYRIRAFGPDLDQLYQRTEALLSAETAEADRIAARLISCCRHPHIVTVDDGLHYHLTEQRCRSRVCPRCAKIRARALAMKITTIVRQMDDPRFLTLTVRSNDQPLRHQVKFLRRRFAAMRRRPLWGFHVTGGVYTIEITHNPSTGQWHPHLHAIIDGKFFPHSDLQLLWEKTVSDHAGVDIRAVRGVRKLANYMASYVAKSCDLSQLRPAQLTEWAIETHGLRLAQTFGCLQSCKPQSTDPDELEPRPIRHVEIDVHGLAWAASWGHPEAQHILEALEPRRGLKPPIDHGLVLGAINRYNAWTSSLDLSARPPPRERDLTQLTFID